MTPEEAESIIDGLDPADPYDMWSGLPGRYDHSDMYAACETIAGLRTEYVVEEDAGYWRQVGSRRFLTLEEAHDYLGRKKEDAPMRILQRYISDWETVVEY